jgi:hypothetical protein
MKFDSQVAVDNNYFGAKFVGVKIDECDNNSVFEVLFDDFFTSRSEKGGGDDVS